MMASENNEITEFVSNDLARDDELLLTREMRRNTTLLDTRIAPWVTELAVPPVVPPGEMYTDAGFTKDVAMEGHSAGSTVEWKRPCEFRRKPMLYTDGTTRFDVNQGKFGTCYFLVSVAALAEKPDILKEVIPGENRELYGENYDGVFHCKFYFNGEWHDVYCDDYLPVLKGKPLGVRSKDKDEMWVSLLEKAFAKFHGSYESVAGGTAPKSFLALTGGLAESTIWKNCAPEGMYDRIKSALRSEGVISCVVPKSNHKEQGLIGGHAYNLTGAAKVTTPDGEEEILRIRNPWGTGHGEWQGRWADSCPAWEVVTPEVRETLCVRRKRDGEFWIGMDDFREYFSSLHICNFTPDFDKDGEPDQLNEVVTVLGDWKDETAAGRKDKMSCPKYILEVSDEDVDTDGKTPIAIQIMQTLENRRDNKHVYMRVDLYKTTPGGEVVKDLTKSRHYRGFSSYCYRYRLKPGHYMVLPHTYNAGSENGFIIRVFSRRVCTARLCE